MNFLKACTALLCFTLAVLPFSVAVAQTTHTADDEAVSEPAEAQSTDDDAVLEPVVITATIGQRTVGESLSSVTVLDRETLRERDPEDIGAALRGQPGIDITTNGSFGKNTSVFTRGTGSESTVFLVDGVRVRSATTGGAPWALFPVELVERMEVVRGPRSALYGADAVGGVVQAFTLDPGADETGYVEGAAGNYGAQRVRAGVAMTEGPTRYSLSGLFKQADGAPVVPEGDDKGYQNTAGIGRVVHTLPNGGEASAVVVQSDGNTEFEGGDTDFRLRTVGLQLDTPVSDRWLSSLQISEARDEQETRRPGRDTSRFNTLSRTVRWENTLFGDVHEVALGGELQADQVDSTTDYDETGRTNAALFSQLRLDFGAADAQIALRVDDNQVFGSERTGAVALGYQLDSAHRARASYSTSFRAPSFNDLYFPGFGNPDLSPENGVAREVGLSARYRYWFWDVALYQLDIDNLIANTTDAAGNFGPQNVDSARIRGVEVASGMTWEEWRLGLSLTLQSPRDLETDNRLVRRTQESLRLDVDRTLGNISLGGSLVAKGDRYNDAANDDRLDGFATLDLRGSWQFQDNWTGRMTIDNVLNETYVTTRRFDGVDYISAGTTALLSVRYDF